MWMNKSCPLFTGISIVLLCFFFLLAPVRSEKIDVNAEIGKLEQWAESIKSSPQIINGMIQQAQVHCKKEGRLIDPNELHNASTCVEQHFNQTQVVNDVKVAVKNGALETVFRDACVKWPMVKQCLSGFFGIIEDCWDRGTEVVKVLDKSVLFLCGDNNDGERMTLFFAEGGMQCLEKHGDSVKQCLAKINEFEDVESAQNALPAPGDVKTADICLKMKQVYDCTSTGLKKCNDSTPENIATSMLNFAGQAVGCAQEGRSNTYSSSGGSGIPFAAIWMLLVGLVFLRV